MPFLADFHIHSHYSRATTKQLNPENLDYWSRIKGLQVIGTGDCVHPGWLNELRENLEPAGNGLYRIKPQWQLSAVSSSRLADTPLYFQLTVEISSIYKRAGRVRKVHNICVLPDFDAAERFQAKLDAIGNIRSDGRPILGLDSRNLLEMLLESSPDAYLIPAHIWTPWFSVLGSQSGFDSIEECFGDLTPHIFALETGLSSDPAMNRVCSFLDRFRLVSNSDAHSPQKLGREANLFETDLSFTSIRNALRDDNGGFLGTIEFFPHEGKYHYDGHRKCNICWDPLQTLEHGGRCSGCGKPVTRGVLYRVAELADRPAEQATMGKQRYYSITPLPELVAETLGKKSTTSRSVSEEYHRLIAHLGSEFHILLFADLGEVQRVGGEVLAEGIRRLRQGEVITEPGYDGEFGKVRVFRPGETAHLPQLSLFTAAAQPASPTSHAAGIGFDVAAFQRKLRAQPVTHAAGTEAPEQRIVAADAPERQEAVTFGEGVCLVIAGPGSGKTSLLVDRICHLVEQRQAPAARILALTFSNKAAEEIRQRLERRLEKAAGLSVSTFHALGLSIVREHAALLGRGADFGLADEQEKCDLLTAVAPIGRKQINKLSEEISAFKGGWLADPSLELVAAYDDYEIELRKRQLFDLDDLLWQPVQLFKQHPSLVKRWRERFRWILVDEVQDLNLRQYEITRLLAGSRRPNLFLIGDPDQAIYGFRGADVRLLDRLKTDFPSLKPVALNQSFRVPATILQGAGQVLGRGQPLSGTAGNLKIHLQSCPTDRSEADWIAGTIEAMIGGVGSYSMHTGITEGTIEAGITSFRDFAVLCRTSALFELIAEALTQHGIPMQQAGLAPIYQQEPWAEAIALIRAALRGPHVRGEKTALSETRQAMQDKVSVAEALDRIVAKEACADFDRQRVMRFAAGFGTRYGEFLQATSLRQGVDDWDAKAERVSLMTMHAAKGLEFMTVFVPGCEEGLIPFEQFGEKTGEALAEEQRLLYVAMTRTKRFLFLSHAAKRFMRGKAVSAQRSRYLERIELALVENAEREGRPVPAEMQLSIW